LSFGFFLQNSKKAILNSFDHGVVNIPFRKLANFIAEPGSRFFDYKTREIGDINFSKIDENWDAGELFIAGIPPSPIFPGEPYGC